MTLVRETKSNQRIFIALGDQRAALEYIDHAQKRAAEIDGNKWDPVYSALVCAAIIYYVRPFTSNDRPRDPDAQINLTDAQLEQILPSTHARGLHRWLEVARNKMVAHAESDLFQVHLIQDGEVPGIRSERSMPDVDLALMRANTIALCDYFSRAYRWNIPVPMSQRGEDQL